MKKKKNFSLKEEYKKSWSYIRESKKYIWIIVCIFFLFALIGFFVPVPDIFYQKIIELIEDLLGKTSGMNSFELTRFIFFNNIKSSFFGMIFGAFFGIFSLIACIVNGYVLGFVSYLSVSSEGVLSLWRLLPHGFFELPAIFISLGLGLRFGTFIFAKDKSETFRDYLWNSLRVFLFIVIPLLIFAAVIEGVLISLLR